MKARMQAQKRNPNISHISSHQAEKENFHEQVGQPRLSRGKHLLLLSFIVLLALVLLEAGLSVFYFQSHAPEPLALIHYVRRATLPGRQPPGLKAVGIWQPDERYGFSHIPLAVGTHETKDYMVTYTIGPDQSRFTPPKSDSRGTILFLGGSYTFGQGVKDNEAFPAVLGRTAWKQWIIENRAVMAWGTAQAFLVLEEALERETPPAAVIYGMIPHHITRNYIRRSWVTGIEHYGLKHPHFELVGGIPEFQGVVGVDQSEKDGPAVREKELALTAAMLRAMHRKGAAKGVPVIVVLLPRIRLDMEWPPQLIRHLYESGIPVLDLTEMPLRRNSEEDRHPNARDHRRIANRISGSFISKMIGVRLP